jgi:hypothetical protein
MEWYERLLETVRDVAPTVAGGATTILTGGNVALGSVVSSVIGKVIGRPGVGLEEASELILGDPDKLMEFRTRMRDAELKELEVRTKDVQNARGLLSASKGPVLISVLVVATFSVLLYMVMFVAIPAASQAVAYVLMGSLATGFSQVLNFWLGTSMGSKEKDDTITRFAKAAEHGQEVRRNNAPK